MMLCLLGVGVGGAVVGRQRGLNSSACSGGHRRHNTHHSHHSPQPCILVSAEGLGCGHCSEGIFHHHHRITLIGSAGCIVGCSALASHEIKLKYVMRGKNLRCGGDSAPLTDTAHSTCFPSGYTVVFLIPLKV